MSATRSNTVVLTGTLEVGNVAAVTLYSVNAEFNPQQYSNNPELSAHVVASPTFSRLVMAGKVAPVSSGRVRSQPAIADSNTMPVTPAITRAIPNSGAK